MSLFADMIFTIKIDNKPQTVFYRAFVPHSLVNSKDETNQLMTVNFLEIRQKQATNVKSTSQSKTI